MKQNKSTKATEQKKPDEAKENDKTVKEKKVKAPSKAPVKKAPCPADTEKDLPNDTTFPTAEELEDPNKVLLKELPDSAPIEESEDEALLREMNEAEKAEEEQSKPQEQPKQNPEVRSATDETDGKKRKWFGKKKEKEQVDPLAGIERFKSAPDKGLTQEQVDLRVSQGLINSAPPK